jgi:hypothetical protein
VGRPWKIEPGAAVAVNVETVRQKVATNLLAARQRGQHQAEK